MTVGAGSAIRIARSFGDVLDAALARVAGCDCGEETSCCGCLRGYRNQPSHEELRRGLPGRPIQVDAADAGAGLLGADHGGVNLTPRQ